MGTNILNRRRPMILEVIRVSMPLAELALIMGGCLIAGLALGAWLWR